MRMFNIETHFLSVVQCFERSGLTIRHVWHSAGMLVASEKEPSAEAFIASS